MFEIEKNIPIPPRHMGRKSEQREKLLATMRAMEPGDSFRIEYKIMSMRNLIRNCGVDGSFRVAQEGDTTVRVWRIA